MAKRDTVVAAALVRLREDIAVNHSIGDQLPNEKDLADLLEVSRATVREALGVLSTEGVISRQWGVGTFVAAPPESPTLNMSTIQSYRDRLQSGGRTVRLVQSSCVVEPGDLSVTDALHLQAGSEVWHVTRVFTLDDQPSARMTEYLPLTLLGAPLDPSPMLSIDTDLFELLNRHKSGCVARTVTDIEAVIAGDAATDLGIDAGQPLLRTEQITLNARDEPLAYGITLQRTDLVRMRVLR